MYIGTTAPSLPEPRRAIDKARVVMPTSSGRWAMSRSREKIETGDMVWSRRPMGEAIGGVVACAGGQGGGKDGVPGDWPAPTGANAMPRAV